MQNKNNKYIVICYDDGSLYSWNNNIIYQGESALKIPTILELKKKYPTAKVYKLTEINI
jgi:hypothetical protein